MKYINITQGYKVIVDDEDYEHLNQWHWQIAKQGEYASRRFWNRETKTYKTITMHRYIMNIPKGKDVDHINGNGLDNRRSNLRLATRSENIRNSFKQSNNTSGFKGVTWHKHIKKWQAQGYINYKHKFLGYFKTKEEAALAYNEFAKKCYGEFARLNVLSVK